MKRFKRGVALAAVTAMCTAMLPSAPIAMGADTDAAVTAFRRCAVIPERRTRLPKREKPITARDIWLTF